MQKIFIILLILISSVSCSHLFYQPSKAFFYSPAQLKLHYEEINFPSSDGTSLRGWYFPAQGQTPQEEQAQESSKGTVIQFHGNAENISTHFASLAWISRSEYNFFTFDYRGYGASKGEPSQEGLNEDAVSAIKYIIKKQPSSSKNSKDIILYGQSLGGAVLLRALHDVSGEDRSRIKAVVIDSSFYSYQAMARVKLSQFWMTFLFQPLAWVLISDSYSPESVIEEVAPIPLLIIHGDKDSIVPYKLGDGIFQRARDPKWFWKVENGTHTDSMDREQGMYRKKLLDFLAGL